MQESNNVYQLPNLLPVCMAWKKPVIAK
jgi:hypothetical protein